MVKTQEVPVILSFCLKTVNMDLDTDAWCLRIDWLIDCFLF